MRRNKEIRKDTMEKFKPVRWKMLGVFLLTTLIVALGNIVPLLNIFIALILPMGLLATMIGIYNGSTEETAFSFWNHGIKYLKNWFCGNLWIMLRLLGVFVLMMIGAALTSGGAIMALNNNSDLSIIPVIGTILMIASYIAIIIISLKYGLFGYVLLHADQSKRARDIVNDTAKIMEGNKWQYFCMMFYYGFLSFGLALIFGIVYGVLTAVADIMIIHLAFFIAYYIALMLILLEMICAFEEFYKDAVEEAGLEKDKDFPDRDSSIYNDLVG